MTATFGVLLLVACLGFCGCSPPGPRALLQGKKLIDEGKPAAAVEKLQKATALLPKNALAWNYLGLAYHGSGQFDEAAQAYRTALALDRKLVEVRYNLGCLYLEQGSLPAAIDEFKSFTLLQPAAADGWLKLGAAQLRARRLDEAERSYRTAIELQARNPEALNGLGMIQVQRRRLLEANNYFNVAAMQEPPYAPAVLNSAVLHHQYLNNRTMALQRYRQYLVLQPRPADWETVESMANQLELELHPPSVAQRPAPVPPVSGGLVARSNAVIAAQNPAPSRSTPVTSPSIQPQPARTNFVASPAPGRATPPAPSASATSSPPAIAVKPPSEASRPAARPAPVKPVDPPAPKPAELEVAHVQPDFAVKPAQDLNQNAIETTRRAAATESDASITNSAASQKRGLLSRLNPFSPKSKTESAVTGTEVPVTNPSALEAQTAQIPRYRYLKPTAPTPGSRADAEKHFKRGVDAYRDGNRAEAIREYRNAVSSDPAYFDAYYNLGLAALERGDARLSLWAYEIALALKPDGVDAHYNFALALKAGGYFKDAVLQLEEILAGNPEDARAHLSAANLYAQQLRQPRLARDHYLRVIEINPRHPEAAKIRFWLASNP